MEWEDNIIAILKYLIFLPSILKLKNLKCIYIYIWTFKMMHIAHMPCSSGQALLLANAAMNYKKREISIYLG